MKIRIILRWSTVRPEDVRQSGCHIFKQLLCRVTGHESRIEVTTGRLALKCARCGWESPGWEIRPSGFGAIRSATH
jgi:hypothetical protein